MQPSDRGRLARRPSSNSHQSLRECLPKDDGEGVVHGNKIAGRQLGPAGLELAAACLVADAAAFKFLSNFKASSLIPRPSSLLKRKRAAAKFGTKKLVVITDASSGLGLQTAAGLLRTGEYHVFGATHDLEKMRLAAKNEDFSDDDFTPVEVDLRRFP